MKELRKIACWLAVLGTACLPATVCGQIQLGNDLKLNAAGGISSSYSQSSSNTGAFGRGFGFGASGTINGSYYSPNFLSFAIMPSYNQSHSNAEFDTLSEHSGISTNAQLFGGSRFPGYLSYNRDYNNEGISGLTQIGDFLTHGRSSGFGVGWSLNLPNRPSLTARFNTSDSSSELQGVTTPTEAHVRTFGLQSNYRIAGFSLNGRYDHNTMTSSLPTYLSTQEAAVASNSNDNIGMTASHALPWHGTFSTSLNRSTFHAAQQDEASSGSSDSYDTSLSFNPVEKLSLFGDFGYSDSLSGILGPQYTDAVVVPRALNAGARAYQLTSGLSYSFSSNFTVHGTASYVQQAFFGRSYSATRFVASTAYSRKLWGMFTWTASLVDTGTADGNSSLGFVSSASFARAFGAWNMSANFSYAQNVQTLLLIYTTSYLNYGASLNRKLAAHLTWSANYNAGHTGITQQAGAGSSNQNVSTNLSYRSLRLGAGYSHSTGTSVIRASGVTTAPDLLPVLDPSGTILFAGTSYSGSASITPIRKLRLTADFSKVSSDTIYSRVSSLNLTSVFNSKAQYDFRKLSLQAGYARYYQSISAANSSPAVASSIYFGVSRWFHFF